MSYRIAVDTDTANASDAKGLFDFTVGENGSIEECVREAWNHGPVAVWFKSVEGLETFLRVWEDERSINDIWRIWRVGEDGKGHVVIAHNHQIDLAIQLLRDKGFFS